MIQPGTSELLRRAAEGLGGSLRAETRQRLIRSGVSAVHAGNAGNAGQGSRLALPSLLARRPFALAAASAVAMVAIALIVPFFLARPVVTPLDEAGRTALTPVRDLSVVADGDRVVLNWNDGGAARKVFRATSVAELSKIRTLPARRVTGETFVDEEPATAPIVYYVIE